MKKLGKATRAALQGEFIEVSSRVNITPGEMIRTLREKMEWTQEDLANKTGLKQATISALEHNRITLGLDRAKVLAIVFNVHPGLLAFPGWKSESRKSA